MKINQKQIDAVLKLSGAERYQHFVKKIADWEEVWGLYQDGWALLETENNQQAFPVWPAKEYAELCAQNEWSGYEPESFSLDDFMEELLPNLSNDGVLPAVFMTPSCKGVTIDASQLISDLNKELENY